MQVTNIQPIRHDDRVDIEVSFDDGTKCTYIIPKPTDPLAMVVSSDMNEQHRILTVQAAEVWVSKNQASINEMLVR